ncbi:MAG: carbohydrate ABC transporter permease [Spirochaetales bacterium]
MQKINIGHFIMNIILVLFFFISILPIYWMWQAAIQPFTMALTNPFAFPTGFTLEYLQNAWIDGKMSIYMRNSVFVAIPRVSVVLVFASLAGFSLGKLRWKGRELVFNLILVGMMIPINAMLIPLYYSIQRAGLINSLWAMVLPYFGLSMPFSCFLLRAFYKELPDEMLESAKIDGANKAKIWAFIMLPLTKPALVSLLIFEFMWSWNDYLIPMLTVYTDKFRTLPIGLMYFQGEYTMNTSLVAAGVTICTLPIIIVYCIFQRSFVQGITAGAVKG